MTWYDVGVGVFWIVLVLSCCTTFLLICLGPMLLDAWDTRNLRKHKERMAEIGNRRGAQ